MTLPIYTVGQRDSSLTQIDVSGFEVLLDSCSITCAIIIKNSLTRLQNELITALTVQRERNEAGLLKIFKAIASFHDEGE